jgi:hypothetical protein
VLKINFLFYHGHVTDTLIGFAGADTVNESVLPLQSTAELFLKVSDFTVPGAI